MSPSRTCTQREPKKKKNRSRITLAKGTHRYFTERLGDYYARLRLFSGWKRGAV